MAGAAYLTSFQRVHSGSSVGGVGHFLDVSYGADEGEHVLPGVYCFDWGETERAEIREAWGNCRGGSPVDAGEVTVMLWGRL